jgi:hypothetical protein
VCSFSAGKRFAEGTWIAVNFDGIKVKKRAMKNVSVCFQLKN